MRNLMHAFCVEKVPCKRPVIFAVNLFCRYLIWHKVPKFEALSFVRLQCSSGLGGLFCSRRKKEKMNENKTVTKSLCLCRKKINLPWGAKKANFIWREVPQGKIKSVVHSFHPKGILGRPVHFRHILAFCHLSSPEKVAKKLKKMFVLDGWKIHNSKHIARGDFN